MFNSENSVESTALAALSQSKVKLDSKKLNGEGRPAVAFAGLVYASCTLCSPSPSPLMYDLFSS